MLYGEDSPEFNIILKKEIMSDKENSTTSTSFFSGWVSTGKDLAALLRDFILLIVFLALTLCPETFNEIMVRAGFEEGSIIGMKWKKGITKSDIALKDSKATITILGKQLDSVSNLLNEVKNETNNPDLKKRITEVLAKNSKIKKESSLVQASVNKTITSNAALVENAQKALNESSTWGVVLGGDSTLKSAQDEVAIFKRKYNISNAVIYLRDKSYRSIVVTNNRTEAEKVLITAKERRPDAYIVPMSTWCQNSAQREGYLECTGR